MLSAVPGPLFASMRPKIAAAIFSAGKPSTSPRVISFPTSGLFLKYSLITSGFILGIFFLKSYLLLVYIISNL